MNADHNNLNLLKHLIGGSVIYENFPSFYQVAESLGQGSAGVVKKYKSKLDFHFYAVKIVDKKKNADNEDGLVQ